MERNIPRAAIHVGTDKNNHYNYSRKRLNFEIVKGGKIVPLGSQSVPLHERLQHRLDELGFKPIWLPSVPTKFQGTVRTALSASSSVVTMMCLTGLPLVNRNSTHQIQMLTTARLYCKKASMIGHWTPTALHVRNGEKKMSSALMCIVTRQASMPMCRPCLLNK